MKPCGNFKIMTRKIVLRQLPELWAFSLVLVGLHPTNRAKVL
jgi:hypothetical protein